MQYCSLQHQILLLSPVCFALAPSLHSFWSYFSTDLRGHIGHLMTWGVPLLVSYHFAFSYCSWGSQARILKWLAIPSSSGPHSVRHVHQESSRKKIYFCFIDYFKAFDCVNHNKLWKILKEIQITDHLTCLLRNLISGQEATVQTGHGTTDWFQIGKGVHQGLGLGLLYIVTQLI